MRTWLRVLAVLALVALVALPLGAAAQRRGRRMQADDEFGNLEYNGRFTFARIRYRGRGFYGYGGSSWSHDYPRADRHLPQILHDLTTIDANLDGSNVLDLEDPAIFDYPLIYLSEPGFWQISEAGAAALRQYLLKGGFIIFDDFEQEQWYNFEAQVKRALPEYQMLPIDISHPIFHSFFEMKNIYFPHPLVPVTPKYFAIFEDNDPQKRMLSIVNYDNDIAEYWEWSDSGMFPVDFTNDAYKLGVNYVVYAMTH
jgi:hypothetical protein